MGEAEQKSTAMLLPAASAAIFSRDQATLNAAAAIAQDWRFARVQVRFEQGDALTAADIFKNAQSPNILVVQTDSIGEDFAEQLTALASACDEHTAAIVIGPVNDVYLYRRLIDMGVSDYLVRPVAVDVLAEVMARTLTERLGVAGSSLIAFAGAKGGVGTSVLAEASSWAVAEILKQKTVLVDASGGWSAMGVGMGFEPSTTLAEAVRAAERQDEDSLKRMMFKASDHLSVLASGGDAMLDESITPAQCEHLLEMLMLKHPVVMVDVSHAPPALARQVLTRANQIFVVSAPTLPSLRLARTLMQELKDLRGKSLDNIEMIINMAGFAPANEVPKADIEKAMEFKVSTTIAFNPKVILGCESQARKLTDDRDGREIVKTHLLPLLSKVIKGGLSAEDTPSVKKSGFLDGLLGRRKTR